MDQGLFVPLLLICCLLLLYLCMQLTVLAVMLTVINQRGTMVQHLCDLLPNERNRRFKRHGIYCHSMNDLLSFIELTILSVVVVQFI